MQLVTCHRQILLTTILPDVIFHSSGATDLKLVFQFEVSEPSQAGLITAHAHGTQGVERVKSEKGVIPITGSYKHWGCEEKATGFTDPFYPTRHRRCFQALEPILQLKVYLKRAEV